MIFRAPAAAPLPPSELDRILALPRRPVVDCEARKVRNDVGRIVRVYEPASQALVEVVTERFARPRPPLADGRLGCACAAMGKPCITTLNAVQAWALRELSYLEGGVVGLQGVGAGKTIQGILAPLAVPDIKLAVLLAKPDQRLHYREAWLRLREHFRVPYFVFDDNSFSLGLEDDDKAFMAGAPVLRFVPYSRLSRPESTELLETLNPDFVIADECTCLSDRRSSRTMRWLRFMTKRVDQGRPVRFCCWSGSLVDKSVKDVAHLAYNALGDGSPLPTDKDEVEAWSAVVDPGPTPDTTSSTASDLARCFAKRNFGGRRNPFSGEKLREAILAGIRSRIMETPGVVSTRAAAATASIAMHEREAPRIPLVVAEALAKMRGDWIRPDGEEIVEAMDQARCVREIANGFSYFWHFEELASAKTDALRGEVKAKIREWFAARKDYHKELRGKLLCGEAHLDSPLLCQNAAVRAWAVPPYEGDLPLWKAATWPRWRDVKDTVQHEQRVEWLDDFLARDAAAWAKEHRGIVWTLNTAFGRKVAELAGIRYHGGGPNAERDLLAESGKQSIVASIKAHGQGRDGLQFKFHEQLVAELPSSGDIWEQLLGRLCRVGQREDTVETWVYLHVHENKDALRKAIAYAEFTEALTPNEQLLLAADRSFEL